MADSKEQLDKKRAERIAKERAAAQAQDAAVAAAQSPVNQAKVAAATEDTPLESPYIWEPDKNTPKTPTEAETEKLADAKLASSHPVVTR